MSQRVAEALELLPVGDASIVCESNGLTLESCGECVGDRVCGVFGADFWVPCSKGTNRVCVPRGDQVCEGEGECGEGEVCALINGNGPGLCMSRFVVGITRELVFATEGDGGDAPSVEGGDGLTLEKCGVDAHCDGTRTCMYFGTATTGACLLREGCYCSPEELQVCESGGCERGEVCARTRLRSEHVCISEKARAEFASEDYEIGLTGNLCLVNEDCKGERRCIHTSFQGTAPCTGQDACACYPIVLQDCEKDEECVDGEVCKLYVTPDGKICMEASVAASMPDGAAGGGDARPDEPVPPGGERPVAASDDDDADSAGAGPGANEGTGAATDGESESREPDDSVCIGAHSLGHLARQDLVFERDRRARVLCDANNSCATPGHIVVWKGDPMMMRRYCEVVWCEKKVLPVNSPKWRRRRLVPSFTRGLQFTTFAARWASTVEEGVLVAAVRVGL